MPVLSFPTCPRDAFLDFPDFPSHRTILTYPANRHITHVLRLLPESDFSALVRCELQEVSLDEKPVYEAISYCWGAPLEFHPILCHDKQLNISPQPDRCFASSSATRHKPCALG